MKSLILISAILFGSMATAQTSVVENDSGSNAYTILGRQLRFSFFSFANVESNKASDEGGRLTTYNYITAATYFNSDYRLAFRVPFNYNTAGTDRFNGEKVNKAEFILQDLILSAQNYNLMYLPADFELYWEGRAYLPTSENSQNTGLITKLRNNFILSRYLNRYFEFEYDQKFSYYIQSKKTAVARFTDEDGYPVEAPSATRTAEFENSFRLWGKITPKVSLGAAFQLSDSWFNKSEENGTYKPPARLMALGPQIAFPITTRANFIFAYADQVDRDVNKEELGQFLAKNSNFQLLSFVSF